MILKESPALIGPQLNGSMVCFNCCKNLRRIGYIFCPNCKTAIICNPKCTGKNANTLLLILSHSIEFLGRFHNDLECQQLKDSHLKGEDIVNNEQIIFPLRILLLKFYNPEKWSHIMKLEPHMNFRRDTPIWRRHKIVVEDALKSLNLLNDQDVTEEIVQRICGILDVNTFEVRPLQTETSVVNPEVECLRGLYLEAALMTHDCLSNTHLSVDSSFVMTVHASVDIPKGEIIYFNYANVLQGSFNRKQHLREGKYFECQCQRCKDPTELGSELSSLKCHKCIRGTIRPAKPHEIKTNWECVRCKTIFAEGLIRLTVAEGKRLIQDVDLSNLKMMEELLEKLQRTFHPQHYLIMDMVQNLISQYGRSIPSKRNLARKVDLCNRLLKVLDKIEPGISRLRAITMYELQSTEIDLAHKEYRDKEISINDLINRLIDAEGTLKTAAKYLLYEPQRSPEGHIAQNALSELKLLRQSIISIQRDAINVPPEKITKKKKEFKNKNESEKVITLKEVNSKKEERGKGEDTKVNSTEGKKKRRNRKKNK